ncbi:hypothetical protein [Lactobacillus delbrueckii]|jgi:hypothetical protein|uniref:hypothetical protein n=1 Tax=Lactobacillus delbrueckii TaxID=1584 RepID=UPI001E355010|nr:hypothetical protein [Lactobacillus delbrueckii]MCD5440892.1 hypothetical protein [Lactobacillus delbrueckii subsp. lactis]MCD5484722.1 hypothetical protein [Lactobacillus delbrueckii subsp. lactis]
MKAIGKLKLPSQINIKISSLSYFFLYSGVFFNGMGLTNSSKVYLGVLLFAGILVTYKISTNKYNFNEALLVLLLIFTAVGSFAVTHKPTLALTCLCIAGMQGVNLDTVFEDLLKIRLGTLILTLLLVFVGLKDNKTVTMWRDGQGLITRQGLGFGHPNIAQLSLFLVIALLIHKKRGSLKLVQYLACVVVNAIFYKFTGSRTGFLLILLLLGLNIIFSVCGRTKLKGMIGNIPFIIGGLCIGATFLSALFYKQLSSLDQLNRLFTNRIAYNSYYLKNYGLTLLGNRGLLLDENAQLDNSYAMIELQYGLLAIIVITLIAFQACRVIKKSERTEDVAIATVMLIYMVFEGFGANIFMNILFLYAVPLLFRDSTYEAYDVKKGSV